jgi:type II secretory pathway component PulF
MPQFSYIARSAAGERVDGRVDAADRRGALIQVERMGLVPVSVTEGSAQPSAKSPAKGAAKNLATDKKPKEKQSKAAPRHHGRPRMALRELLLFTGELSDLLSSGMTLGNALNTLSRRKTKRGQDAIVTQLRDDIIRGASLSDALAVFPDTFSGLYVNMVRAGEASGQLSETLERLGKHYERLTEAREKVALALIYPGFVLSMGVVTMVFVMIFVVPRFSIIFAELGSTLPLPTQILISVSGFLLHYGWAVAIGLIFLVVALRRYIRTPIGKKGWHKLQLRIPVVRNVITANAYAQFARTLGALLANGVPVLQALSIVENTIGNVIIAEEIREARDRVTDGSTISGPLAAGKVFPPLLTDMLAVGEQSGDMPGALAHIARRYDSDLDRNVKVFTTILEPVLIVLMAVMVGYVAISMLLAVFDLTSGLNIK